MRIHASMGDFWPRPEHGWPDEPSRRCHILGSRVVQLQGGMGVIEVAARNGDLEGTRQGLNQIRYAAEGLENGLPENRAIISALRNRAKLLEALVAPYPYGGKLPKRISTVITDQIKAMGDHELKLEAASIAACGGHLTGAHSHHKDEKLEPLPAIPKGMTQEAKRLKISQEAKLKKKTDKMYRAYRKRMEKRVRSK